MLGDSDDEMSHTSLCNMSVEPARKPAFVSFLCVTSSSASTGHAVASTKAYLTDRTTDSRHTGKAVREIHADATGGRGHERRSARRHKARPLWHGSVMQEPKPMPKQFHFVVMNRRCNGVLCSVQDYRYLSAPMASAYIRCIHLLITRMNSTPHSRIASHRPVFTRLLSFSHCPHPDLVYHIQPCAVPQGLDLGLSSLCTIEQQCESLTEARRVDGVVAG